MKDEQRTRGDQKAFLGLVDHVLGPNNVSNMASEAENWLVKTVYQERRNGGTLSILSRLMWNSIPLLRDKERMVMLGLVSGPRSLTS